MDNQINVVSSPSKTHMLYNVESGNIDVSTTSDSIVDMAADVGIVGAINDINKESVENDQQLREDHEIVDERQVDEANYQQAPDQEQYQDEQSHEGQSRKKGPKNKGDKRFNDLTYRYVSTNKELEQERQRNQLLESEIEEYKLRLTAKDIANQKKDIEDSLNRVSDIMLQATQQGDTKTYVEATKYHNQLLQEEYENKKNIEQLTSVYENRVKENESNKEYYNQAEETLLQLSDVKDLQSPYYSDWLNKNDFYNPYSENYDGDLALETREIKKSYNKFLKLNKKSDHIGTKEYYDEVDNLMQIKLLGVNQQFPIQPQYNQDYQSQGDTMSNRYSVHIDPNYEKNLPQHQGLTQEKRYHQSVPSGYVDYNAPVAPVTRGGYQGGYGQERLPELNETQRMIALRMPATDQQGRPLTPEEKILEYRRDLAGMNRK